MIQRTKAPPWSRAEDVIIRAAYPIRGASGCYMMIRGRSIAAITFRAQVLGLRYEKPNGGETPECRNVLPEPTDSRPGTREKIETLRQRVAAGEILYHPQDAGGE